VPVKAHPHITVEWLRRIEEFGPDRLFILDIALVDQEFIDRAKVPITWLDHHTLQDPHRCDYYNPRKRDNQNVCTPILCWQIIGKDRPQDLWIASVGAIGDWQYPPFAEEFKVAHPELLPMEIVNVEDALFHRDSKVAVLAKVFSFNLKGKTSDVMKSVKVFTRIEDPLEILRQTSSRGRLLWKRYEFVNQSYDQLKERALKAVSKDPLLVFTYQSDELSLTKDLANELLYLHRDKIVILGREKSGEMRCSLRSGPDMILTEDLQKALVGVQGMGGGHEHACGVAVKVEDFSRFLENLRRELGK
jgi:single-stranded DNA-specific DHH superfamily exonuclease